MVETGSPVSTLPLKHATVLQGIYVIYMCKSSADRKYFFLFFFFCRCLSNYESAQFDVTSKTLFGSYCFRVVSIFFRLKMLRKCYHDEVKGVWMVIPCFRVEIASRFLCKHPICIGSWRCEFFFFLSNSHTSGIHPSRDFLVLSIRLSTDFPRMLPLFVEKSKSYNQQNVLRNSCCKGEYCQ